MNPEVAGDSLPLKFIATGTKTGLPMPLEMMYEKGLRDGVGKYKVELLEKLEAWSWKGLTPPEGWDDGYHCALERIIYLIKGE